ncbi:MAG: transcriptional attenuator, LytR family, partial [Actinomycetia bacterium]|nr:transcriptional attenuator, LytR family [Actinomycetes bacterium]
MTFVSAHWRRIMMVTLSIPLVIALALAGLFTAWLHGWQIPLASGKTYLSIEKVGDAHFGNEPTGTTFFLVIGNDSRPGVGGSRGDALHLIGVNPALHQATILDIPRDTEVQIPGHGRDKINAANAYGGPQLTAQTVSAMVGFDIPYAVQTDFAGFTSLIDDMGGISITIPTPMHDSYSGANFDAGPAHLSGDQALRFSRDRHSFPTSDLVRTQNQGLLIIAALAQLRAQNNSVTGQFKAVAALGRHTQLVGVSITDLYSLLKLGMSVDPAQVRNVLLPWGPGNAPAASAGGL